MIRLPRFHIRLSKGLLALIVTPLLFGCFGGSMDSCSESPTAEELRLRASFSPRTVTLNPGEERDVTVTISEVDPIAFPVEGVQAFTVDNTAAYDVTPNSFSLNFTGVTERTQTLRYRVKEGATPQEAWSSVAKWQGNPLTERFTLTVGIGGGGTGALNIFSDQNTLILEDYEQSEEVEFSVYSTSFVGEVQITDSGSAPHYEELPANVPDKVTLTAPNRPVTFKKRFRKFPGAPVEVTFTAKALPNGPTKTTTVLLRNP